MFSSRNTLIQNKNVGKAQHQILRLIIILSLSQLMLNTEAVNSELFNDASSNLLVLKNNKIACIKVNKLIDKTNDSVNQRVWITNTQQAFKIEIFEQSITNSQYFTKLSQSLPLLSANLQTKSYIKPITSSLLSRQDSLKTTLIRGYKYFKPSFTNGEDSMLQEIGQFLKVLIKQNKLGYLSLRMQDSFNIQLIMLNSNHTDNSNSFIVTSFEIKYLFPTVQHTSIPLEILSTLTVKTLQQYLQSHTYQIIERKLSGKGFHMMINLTLTLDDKTDIEIQSIKDSCWLKFTDVLPETTYVDADQRREEITNYETINIQKPAFDSKQYFYSYKVALNQFHQVGVNKYLYQQPIHFRYPLPSQLNYTKVYLHPIQQAIIICLSNSDSRNNQAGLQNDSQEVKIYSVEENALFDRGTAKIPNGDISKAKIVSIVTLAVCIVAVMMIISKLKKF